MGRQKTVKSSKRTNEKSEFYPVVLELSKVLLLLSSILLHSHRNAVFYVFALPAGYLKIILLQSQGKLLCRILF